jgi:hypothetical protein
MTDKPIENVMCDLCRAWCQDSEIEEIWAIDTVWKIGQRKEKRLRSVKACWFCRWPVDEPLPITIPGMTDNRNDGQRLSSSTNHNENDMEKQTNEREVGQDDRT